MGRIHGRPPELGYSPPPERESPVPPLPPPPPYGAFVDPDTEAAIELLNAQRSDAHHSEFDEAMDELRREEQIDRRRWVLVSLAMWTGAFGLAVWSVWHG